jgi:hypothetical protein
MKIAFITTVDHNIGDDFVREGIKYLLRQYFKNNTIEFQNIHKHSPITTRYGFEWFRNYRLSSIADKVIPKNWSKDRVSDADILIQSGAPVYWCHDGQAHCCQNEWYKPLIKERFSKNIHNTRLLNLAAGTCQRYHSKGNEFCLKCNTYIKEFFDLTDVTTVRDKLAQIVLSKNALDVPVIPCSSIFAADEYGLKVEDEDYVAINYMRGGAHYTFGQNIDFEKWESEFKKFYFKIKEKERVVFCCHDKKEIDEAKKIDAKAEVFYRKDDFLAYMRFYSKAKFGILNRVHGAFLLASYGKPSIVIGNDSRAKMCEEIGVESFFVNDADYTLLCEKYDFLNSGANNFSARFKMIKEKAFENYMTALSTL